MTRGIQQQMDIWKKFMETRMLMWKRQNLKSGQEEIVQVQGALRPVQLWEYVFPEECLPEVVTMLHLENYHTKKRDGYNGIGYFTLANKAKLLAMRKALGAEKFPDINPVPTNQYVELGGVAVHPIGIKRDTFHSWGDVGYKQEML